MLDLLNSLLAGHETALLIVTGLVTVASGLANVISDKTIAGKILHWVALNLTTKTK